MMDNTGLTLTEAERAMQVMHDAIELQASSPVAAGVIYYDEGESRLQSVDIDQLIEGMTREDVIAACATNFNFLAKFMLPDVCMFDFPHLLVAVWDQWVSSLFQLKKRRGEYKVSTSLPRGMAKSTMLKLFAVYTILFSPCSFIAIVGSVNKKALHIVEDVLTMLGSPQVRTIFGHWDADVKENNKDLKRFKFMGKDIMLVPIGAVTDIRGVNLNNRRIDVLIMDDVQSEENARSVVESATLSDWILNTLIPALSAHGGLVLYVGNVYAHAGSFLDVLIAMPSWLSLTLGAILADGSALWEELHPKTKILQAYGDILVADKLKNTHRGEAAWLAQFMNVKDFESNSNLSITAVRHLYSIWETGRKDLRINNPEASFIVLDLSTGKAASDNATIMVVEVYEGRTVCVDIEVGLYDPEQYVKAVIRMALRHNTSVVFNEDVGYQATNKYWLDLYLSELDMPKDTIEVINFSPPRSPKLSRIKMSFAELMSGLVLLAPPVLQQYHKEFKTFDPNKSDNNDNVMDTVQHVSRLWEGHADLLRRKQLVLNQFRQQGTPVDRRPGRRMEIPL